MREDVHHALVASAGPALLVEPRHRLGVVVVDVRLGLEHGANRIFLALEIGHEHFDRRRRTAQLDLPDGLGEGPRAEVGEVVAIDGREDDVLQLHHRRRFGDALRLRTGRTSADGRARPRSRRSFACRRRRGS